ncbi:hypothetical protein BDK51DRAFT_40279 [Blyttiomyces helicus]|uniref:Uncharacterized protein n=1 Tax=Blyttiomyces helicus TaxID=388810 RepID=A0A4V1IQ75_9FUNG|nr:hypothetical protein BDK51DRAFT_40279 [Blyttiomyces helicus]|eukprot:RKO85577.1 hypothetical protein BDK51DRAFT_40279 [Blyttiomyces helicus]
MTKKGGGSESNTSIITNSVIGEEKLRPRKSQHIPFRNVDNGAELRFLPSEYVEIPNTDDELSVHTSDEKTSTYDSSDDQAISDDGSEDDIELILNYNDSSTVNGNDHSAFAVSDKDHKDDVDNVEDVEDVVEEDDDQDEDYRDEDQNSKDSYDENNNDDNSTESSAFSFDHNVGKFKKMNLDIYKEFDLAMISEDWMNTNFHDAMFSAHISRLLSFGKNKDISIEWMQDIQKTVRTQKLHVMEYDIEKRNGICDLCDLPKTLTKKLVINDIEYCTGRNCCANLRKAILFYEKMQRFFNDQKKRRVISLNEIFSFWNKSSN